MVRALRHTTLMKVKCLKAQHRFRKGKRKFHAETQHALILKVHHNTQAHHTLHHILLQSADSCTHEEIVNLNHGDRAAS